MKFIFVFSCLIAMAWSAPSSFSAARDAIRHLPAVRHEEVHDEYGQYTLRYITAENTVVSETGRLIPSLNGDYVLVIEGQYEFIGDDGLVYATRYHGGPDGFQVDATHLPKPVPVPVI